MKKYYTESPLLFKCKKCGHITSYHYLHTSSGPWCSNCKPIVQQSSRIEFDVITFLKNQGIKVNPQVKYSLPISYDKCKKIFGESFVNQFEFTKHSSTRQRSFDIETPNYFIEVHGLEWHSIDRAPESIINKIFDSIELGKSLLTIYDGWWNLAKTRRIIESILKVKHGKASNVVYARNVSIIKDSSIGDFIDSHHLFGYHKYGGAIDEYALYDGDKIVGAFTVLNKESHIELHRLCFEFDTVVVGGLQKILAVIKKHYSKKLRCYMHSEFNSNPLDSAYAKAGLRFVKAHKTFHVFKPSGSLVHRLTISKNRLAKEFKRRGLEFDPSKSQFELASRLGYKIVYSLTYEYCGD